MGNRQYQTEDQAVPGNESVSHRST
jgi:hypothetical protein